MTELKLEVGSATPPLTIADFPLCRALSAPAPKVEPRRFVRWFNVYPDGQVLFGRGGHHTKALADNFAGLGRIACIRVEFTEGQFDKPQPGDPV